jgi:hypothetical protein
MTPRRAVSFLEIVMAVLLLAILVGPLTRTVSSLNQGASGTVFELTAAHFASEILEQVQVLPVATLLTENQVTSLADLKGVLEIPNRPEPLSKVELCPGVFLLASAMPPDVFSTRVLSFEKETRAIGNTMVQMVRATVHVFWKTPGTKQEKRYSASTYLLES